MEPRSFGQNFLTFFCVLVAEKKIVRFMKIVMDFFDRKFKELVYDTQTFRIFSDFSVLVSEKKNG